MSFSTPIGRAIEQFTSVPVIKGAVSFPRYNMQVTDEQVRYEIILPGYSRDDVVVTCSPGRLDISSEAERDYTGYLVLGSRVAPFSLSLQVPASSTIEGAAMRDGVLTVTLRKEGARVVPVSD